MNLSCLAVQERSLPTPDLLEALGWQEDPIRLDDELGPFDIGTFTYYTLEASCVSFHACSSFRKALLPVRRNVCDSSMRVHVALKEDYPGSR